MVYILTDLIVAFITLIASILLLYVLYRAVRLSDILDVIKRKYEIEAKALETEAAIDLALTKQLAEKYGVDITEPTRLSKRETILKKINEAEAQTKSASKPKSK